MKPLGLRRFFQVSHKHSKTVLGVILAITALLPSLFFVTIRTLHLTGWSVYFSQLALYTVLYGLAYWGIATEKIVLPLNGRKLWEAIGILLASWLGYILILTLSGAVSWANEVQNWQNTPIWKVGAQLLNAWFFVGMAEEFLFRGYFLTAFQHHFSHPMAKSILLTSAVFSLWHLPVRIHALITGEMSLPLLLISLIIVFALGTGFAWLFVRTQNILAAGLVHGIMDYPLLGAETQLSFLILALAIACVEMSRRLGARTITDPEQKQ